MLTLSSQDRFTPLPDLGEPAENRCDVATVAADPSLSEASETWNEMVSGLVIGLPPLRCVWRSLTAVSGGSDGESARRRLTLAEYSTQDERFLRQGHA